MATLTHIQTLVSVTCWCGVAHAIPQSLNSQARDKKTTVYCPLGHAWVYTKTNAERLEEERQYRERAERRLQATRDLLAAEERSHASTRGHLTRQRKRAAAGVCPCCNRTFQQLARHMKAKHPDFKPESTTA